MKIIHNEKLGSLLGFCATSQMSFKTALLKDPQGCLPDFLESGGNLPALQYLASSVPTIKHFPYLFSRKCLGFVYMFVLAG